MTQDAKTMIAAQNPTTPGVSRARSWSSRLAVLVVAATLAACSSGVKLDDVPVENRSATAVSPGSAGGQSAGVDQQGVAGVQVGGNDAMQPENMERVVYFDYDSFEVRAEFAPTLEAHARYLKTHTGKRVALEGHTDDRGGREYNLALGQKRGEAVRRALALLGVSDAQMEAVSFGEEKPAVTGASEAAYAKNRRVELTYR